MFKKLNSKKILLSTLISSTCALIIPACDSSSSPDHNLNTYTTEISGKGIDPDFQYIVDRFEIEANNRNISVDLDGLDIQYGDTDGAYGVCFYLGTDTKDIIIHPILKNEDSDLVSEIILHELGHCILQRDHSDDPTSIMHESVIIGEPWRTEVLDELFYH